MPTVSYYSCLGKDTTCASLMECTRLKQKHIVALVQALHTSTVEAQTDQFEGYFIIYCSVAHLFTGYYYGYSAHKGSCCLTMSMALEEHYM